MLITICAAVRNRRRVVRSSARRGDLAGGDACTDRSGACVRRAAGRPERPRFGAVQPDRGGRVERRRRVSVCDAWAWAAGFARSGCELLALGDARSRLADCRRTRHRCAVRICDRKAGAVPAHTTSGSRRARRVPDARTDRRCLRRFAARVDLRLSGGVRRRTCAAAVAAPAGKRVASTLCVTEASSRKSGWPRAAKKNSRPIRSLPVLT